MHQLLNDPIDVFVSFSGHRVRPRKFVWDGRDYDVKTVNLIHAAREGGKRLFYFSVSDAVNYFKLKLDTELLEWHLVEVYAE
jgi:nucleoside-diphosphate-sugar epimerase